MTRVVLVDDAATDRLALRAVLEADPSIEVVGEGGDGEDAVELRRDLAPDVVVMDVLMPRLDGFGATERIMRERPCPIVLVSNVAGSGDVTAVRALAAGAVSLLEKPGGPASAGFARRAAALQRAVRTMQGVHLVRRRSAAPAAVPSTVVRRRHAIEVVAVAASTGGPRAVADVLGGLPRALPVPVLVVQHIGAGFERSLVEWLDEETPLAVRLAADGDPLRPGVALVGPAGSHLTIDRKRRVSLSQDAPAGGHRPSATHLFRSIAQVYGSRAAGVVLTGMGRDGVAGLVDLHERGGLVVAQDEATSVVYGMPKEAVAAGAVDVVLPVEAIAGQLLAWV